MAKKIPNWRKIIDSQIQEAQQSSSTKIHRKKKKKKLFQDIINKWSKICGQKKILREYRQTKTLFIKKQR